MKNRLLIFLLCTIALCSCNTTKKMVESNHLALVGTEWQLESIEGQYYTSSKEQVKPYIVFDTASQYHGNFGCNDFFGSYYLKKKKLQLTYAGATKKLCSEMTIERAMMKAIKADISTYTIRGNNLILYSGKKEILRFSKK